jgi:hypothetical protein
MGAENDHSGNLRWVVHNHGRKPFRFPPPDQPTVQTEVGRVTESSIEEDRLATEQILDHLWNRLSVTDAVMP